MIFLKKKPRICAVGIISNIVPEQIVTLMNYFSDRGIQSIITTTKKKKLFQFLDILFFLPMNTKKYDVLHIQTHSYRNIIVLALAVFWGRVLKKKIIVMYYGGAAHEFFSNYPRLIKFLFQFVDQTIVAGNYVKRAFDNLQIKTTIIPHILEIDKWPHRQRNSSGYHLLWVRHLRSEYNPIMLLQLFKQLKGRFHQLELKIVGTGPLQEEMKNYIFENSLNDIELLGRVSDTELKLLFDKSDIFINTTNVDNQPVSVLEAMTCGLPVVSTNVGGIPDIITHGQNGLLSNPCDVDAMLENIQLLLENSELASKLSKNGRAFVEKTFSPEVVFYQWADVYNRIGFSLYSIKK